MPYIAVLTCWNVSICTFRLWIFIMSRELREFLSSKGVALSRTSSYKPEGNGQAERCNGVIWKAVATSLRSKNLPLKNWQDVLPDVYTLSVLSCVLLPMNLHLSDSLVSHADRLLASPFLPGWLHLGPCKLNGRCAQAR